MAEKSAEMRQPDHDGPVVDLQAAVSSLVTSILAARVTLDAETARVARLYQENDIMKLFAPPAFSMGEVTVRLPYAPLDVAPQAAHGKSLAADEVPHMKVLLEAGLLARLPPHAVGVVEVRLNQEQLSVLLTQPAQ